MWGKFWVWGYFLLLFILLGSWWNTPRTYPIHHIIIKVFIWPSLTGIKFLIRNLYLCKDKLLSSAFYFSLCFRRTENVIHLFLFLSDNFIQGILEHFFCIYILAWVHHIVILFTAFLLSLSTSLGENQRRAEARYIKPQSFGCLIFHCSLLSYLLPVLNLVI